MNRRKTQSVVRRLAGVTILALLLAALGATIAWAMATSGAINGTVTSPGGYPLPPGTVVKLFEPGSETVHGQANVDLNTGAFSLGPVANGLYVLKAIPPVGSGYTQSPPVPVSVMGGPVTGVIVPLTRPQILGTVLAPGGLPVTATVQVFLGSGDVLQVVPAPGGQFAIGGLPVGNYALRARPETDDPFWFSQLETISIGGPGTQTLTLTLRMAQFWGEVKDNLGNPVRNAIVHAADAAHPRMHHTDRTSATGFWAIGGLPLTGDFVIAAEPPFHRPELLPSQRITITLPGASNPYTLTLNASPKIVSGTVTSNLGGSNGLPVQNALVVAHRVDRQGEARTLSGTDGRYQLNLSAGLWALTVKPISTTTPTHWVFPLPPQLVHFRHDTTPEGKTQDFRVIIADSTVVGSVQLPGGTLGVPGTFSVTVALFNNEGVGRQTTVQVSEPFTLRVPHGGYRVVVHPRTPQYLGPVIDPIRVEPGSTYNLGALTLVAKDAAITGTVRDDGGSGVAGIPVVAWRAGAPDTLRTRTGPDGQYVLPLVAGTWHVQPAPGPAQPYLYTGDGQSVTLASGEVKGGINFDLTDASATINGQLVDEAGNPLTDVDGWARAFGNGMRSGAPIQGGQFAIFVPPGKYSVVADLPAGSEYMSGASKPVVVTDSISVTLTVLEKDAVIAGGLWDPRKQEVVSGVDGAVGVWADGNWAATRINKGNGTFRMNVAAGLWRLGYRIDPDSGYVKIQPHINVPVDPRQTAVVPLWVVQKDGVITGTVLDPNGQPRAGVPVVARAVREAGKGVELRTLSADDGTFRLDVPHARYRLAALGGGPNLIKPAERIVDVGAGETSGGHVLQFRAADATLSGALTIAGPSGLSGEALVWAWSEDGGFIKGRFPITAASGTLSGGFYTLNVLSNTTWHIGAAFETDTQFWFVRDVVTLGSGNATLNLTLTGPHAKPGPVVVTFDAADPQRIELADGTHIFIPAGAMPVSGEVTLRIVPIATLPHQRHADVYKYGYAFLATDSSGQTIEDHFNQDVVIGFRYTDAELAALNIFEPNLRPAYYSTTDDNWTFPESYAVDTDANIVTMQIDHFTDFALTAGEAQMLYLPLVLK